MELERGKWIMGKLGGKCRGGFGGLLVKWLRGVGGGGGSMRGRDLNGRWGGKIK